MKLADLDNPVQASWLAEQGFRLNAAPYVSEAYQARKLLERLPHTDPLAKIADRIFHPGIFRREWTTSREDGVPFLGSASIFQADLSNLPMITKKSFRKTARLPLKPGWTLITCSGMTSGRITCARPDMDGMACSQDVIRVVADSSKIADGYLYAFLASHYGKPIIQSRVYGTSIKHLEPAHLADIPVPRLDADVETEIDGLIRKAMALRAEFQAGVIEATRDLFESGGLPELIDFNWHDQPRDLDFSVTGLTPTTLRALNLSPRALRVVDALRSVPHRTLGDICAGGYLGSGARFKRIDADEQHGAALLVGQRQGFWLRPEGRWINPRQAPSGIFARDESVMIAAQGTLGENEVFCRPIFVTGSWLSYAYTQHFLRVVSGDPEIPGAYLYAFLRSEAAFRILRSMSVGGKQQDIHEELRQQIPVPECAPEDRGRIAETVRKAYRLRDEADTLEDRALALLDEAVREAAR